MGWEYSNFGIERDVILAPLRHRVLRYLAQEEPGLYAAMFGNVQTLAAPGPGAAADAALESLRRASVAILRSYAAPESAARDLQSIIETHLGARKNVVIAGYSRGADVLPAMIARMPQETQSKIRLVALLAPSPRVEFEFHVADWMHDSKRGMLVRPELEKVRAKTLCIWGEDDRDSLCTGLAQPNVQVVTLRRSHHFEGDYVQLAKIILEGLK